MGEALSMPISEAIFHSRQAPAQSCCVGRLPCSQPGRSSTTWRRCRRGHPNRLLLPYFPRAEVSNYSQAQLIAIAKKPPSVNNAWLIYTTLTERNGWTGHSRAVALDLIWYRLPDQVPIFRHELKRAILPAPPMDRLQSHSMAAILRRERPINGYAESAEPVSGTRPPPCEFPSRQQYLPVT